jgi:hypothetical protein
MVLHHVHLACSVFMSCFTAAAAAAAAAAGFWLQRHSAN